MVDFKMRLVKRSAVMKFYCYLTIGIVFSLGLIADIANAQEASIPLGGNLVAEGIPSIPKTLAEDVRKYTEARGASFLDWHPTNTEMLISTRFANSNQVHRVGMPGGARYQLTYFTEPVGAATYEPNDGRYFVFSKDTGGNEFAQLFRFDLAEGRTTLLTDGGRSQNGGVVWSRLKNQIAYMSTRRNGADRDLWLMDPANPDSSRILFELTGGGWGATDWSADDRQILLQESLSINKSYIWLVDVVNGEKRKLLDPETEVAFSDAKFSADGKSIFTATDWESEFLRLCTIDLASGKIIPLTSDIPWDIEFFEPSPDRSRIVFAANEAGVSRLYLLDAKTLKYVPIAGLPSGVCSGCRWHADGKKVAVTFSSAKSTSDVYVVDLSATTVTRWTESELGGLQANDLTEPELIRWKSFDDREISGFYYKPQSVKFPGKRPVIINIHGGPEGQSRPIFLGRNNYFINEMGVALIYPNVRGSSGFGKTYLKLDNGIQREDSVRDIGALLDWISQQEDLDASRVMVTGGSYGGYMTLAVATQFDDRIRCSLDVVGISHFGTFLKNTESYRRDLRRVEYGDERDPKIAAFFEKIAPLNNAAKITKPLFIVQGGNDPRVPLSEAEQMRDKVKQNKGEVWYLMATDEGHGFKKKNNADIQFYSTVMFIQRFLTTNN
ncbi:MAG: peptidase prolyl oligopeptidase active site domain protein [Planctomycetota bacterium]|jgi:dipeptidyl aminopeptidase/acylaminoacyl peptidase